MTITSIKVGIATYMKLILLPLKNNAAAFISYQDNITKYIKANVINPHSALSSAQVFQYWSTRLA